MAQGGSQAGCCTGAAKMYATTIDPNSPGASVIGPDDWKNRMSADSALLRKQIRETCGFPVLHWLSPSAGFRVPER
jgi:hypothetical protein